MGHSLLVIATRTGLPVRQLRYVIYHGLVPELTTASRGRGSTPMFNLNEARRIAIAAALLQAGLSSSGVRACVLHIRDLVRTCQPTASASLRQIIIDDRYYLRCRIGNASSTRIKIDPDHAFPPVGNKPLITIQLDVEQLDRLLTVTELPRAL